MNQLKGVLYVLICMLILESCAVSNLSSAHQQTYDQIEQYYTNLGVAGQSITLYNQSNSLKQILLIRHGEPDLNKKKSIGFRKMQQYIYDYDTVRVKPIGISPIQLTSTKIDTIYSSSLQRAFDTANQLFRDEFIIESDSLFREFEREVVPLPLIKMKPKAWGVWSRFFWVLGLQSRKIEGLGEAKNRSRVIASFLSEKANDNQYAVLVAHGFLNRYLKKELMKSGWQLSYDGGSEYLSVQVLSKIE